MMSNLKFSLNFIGLVLSISGVSFLIYSINWKDFWHIAESVDWAFFILLSLIYTVMTLLLFFAWAFLLFYDTKHLFSKYLLKAYARSICAKYLPGNFFQFVSRQIDLAGNNIAQVKILKSSFFESLSLFAAALLIIGVFSFFTPFWDYPDFPEFLSDWIKEYGKTLPYFFIISALILVFGMSTSAPYCFASLILYLFFFWGLEIIGQEIWELIINDSFVPELPMGLFTLSWLVGFVIIGAPGGLGVRELVIVFFTQAFLGDDMYEAGALAALTLRFVTLLGEMLFVLISFIYLRRAEPITP